jgi:hypothetical protein
VVAVVVIVKQVVEVLEVYAAQLPQQVVEEP